MPQYLGREYEGDFPLPPLCKCGHGHLWHPQHGRCAKCGCPAFRDRELFPDIPRDSVPEPALKPIDTPLGREISRIVGNWYSRGGDCCCGDEDY